MYFSPSPSTVSRLDSGIVLPEDVNKLIIRKMISDIDSHLYGEKSQLFRNKRIENGKQTIFIREVPLRCNSSAFTKELQNFLATYYICLGWTEVTFDTMVDVILPANHLGAPLMGVNVVIVGPV